MRRGRANYNRDQEQWKRAGYSTVGLDTTIETCNFVLHRLRFLEMVVTGLTYMQQHDAQAYARFVESKRNLEDLDLEELRELLR